MLCHTWWSGLGTWAGIQTDFWVLGGVLCSMQNAEVFQRFNDQEISNQSVLKDQVSLS